MYIRASLQVKDMFSSRTSKLDAQAGTLQHTCLAFVLSLSHDPDFPKKDFPYSPALTSCLKFISRPAHSCFIHCHGHLFLDRDRSHGRGRDDLLLSERYFEEPFAVWTFGTSSLVLNCCMRRRNFFFWMKSEEKITKKGDPTPLKYMWPILRRKIIQYIDSGSWHDDQYKYKLASS